MLKTLSGRFLILTIVFVMIAEVLIFVPSIARFREDYLMLRLERAQIASLALLADDMITAELEAELLESAGVYNVVLRRSNASELVLSSPIPEPIVDSFDLRDAGPWELIGDAIMRLYYTEERIARVIGDPVNMGGDFIEVTVATKPLRDEMIAYGLRILGLSAMISIITAALLFFAVRRVLVKPIKGVVGAMQRYAQAPEDARRIIEPDAAVTELREAEEALKGLQTELTGALKQKERLAQLGGAVAKVSHDLRNILTSAQLFTDRIEGSEDPMVARLAPKLVNSITRAVNLCESTLAFGRSDEPPPQLTRVLLADVVADVFDSERLAAEGYDLTFTDDIVPGMMPRADGEQLYRVLGNLVRNARQAIMSSGQPGQISITGTEDPHSWSILVSDTGPGLPPKAREHMFKPFQGGARKGGSGLGLAIAAELIRGHGGRLELIASDEDGTTFGIRLPKADAALDAAE